MQQKSKIKFIIQHVEGHFINLKYEPSKGFDSAARFETEEDANHFLTQGYYRTSQPELYHVVPIKITYELEANPDEREHEVIRKSS